MLNLYITNHKRLTSRHKETKQKKNRQSHKYKYKYAPHIHKPARTNQYEKIHTHNVLWLQRKYGIHMYIEMIFGVKESFEHVRIWMKRTIYNKQKEAKHSIGKPSIEENEKEKDLNRLRMVRLHIIPNTNMCYVWILEINLRRVSLSNII